jgi:hypothetical protein
VVELPVNKATHLPSFHSMSLEERVENALVEAYIVVAQRVSF